MSSANSRPLPPPAPSKRTAPSAPSNDRSTGVRPRTPSTPAIAPSTPVINEASAPTAPVIHDAPTPPEPFIPTSPGPAAEGLRNNSIAPESLRRPYASLAPEPKKRSDTGPRRSVTPAVRPADASGPDAKWDEASSLTNAGSKPSRAICKKHKIARGKNGECMMCRKEEIENSNGMGWKILVGLMVIAVIAGAIAAVLV